MICLLHKFLSVVRESGYSRIPVYDGEIDNIVGIVLAKSVLDFSKLMMNIIIKIATTTTI
jgi:CBS domain containing-hemolysin-like protein